MDQTNQKVKNPAKSMKHWLVLACCCGILASSIGLGSNAFGVFITPVADSLGIYRGTFALQATIAYFGLAVSSLFVPRVLEKIGLKPSIRLGVALASLSTIAIAFTESVWIFNLMGAVRGVGMGFFAMVPMTLIINNWFEERNGLAVSIGFCFSGVGGAIFSPLFTSLIENVSWQFAFIVMGVLFAVLCAPAMFYPFSIDPREDGYLPYGHEEKPKEERKPTSKGGLHQDISRKDLIFIILFSFALLHTSIMGIAQHIPGFAVSINFSSQVGAWMLSAIMIGNITFKLVLGALSDMFGIVKASIIIILIHMVSIVGLIFLRNTAGLLFASWLFGAMFSVTAVSLPLLTSHFYGKSRMMLVYPIFSFAAGTGRSISTTLIGYIFDFTGGYLAAFYIAMAFHIFNIIIITVGEKKRKPLLNQ